MEKKMRILIIGISLEDAQQLIREIESQGHSIFFEWIDEAEQIKVKIDSSLFDIVLFQVQKLNAADLNDIEKFRFKCLDIP
ncbi:MAG: hypothetical protein JW795_08145, partial [Chitinivibrionales bacterium]|nr:hypothetical protein [Chitinivibrionales bacterium]